MPVTRRSRSFSGPSSTWARDPTCTRSPPPARYCCPTWPILQEQAAQLPIGGVFCFPLRGGGTGLGVLTLYRRARRALTRFELAWILAALDLVIGALLAERAPTASRSPLGQWLAARPRSHPIDEATGMLSVQLGIPVQAAFARLRAHAYCEERDIAQVAEDIVYRRLRLEPDLA